MTRRIWKFAGLIALILAGCATPTGELTLNKDGCTYTGPTAARPGELTISAHNEDRELNANFALFRLNVADIYDQILAEADQKRENIDAGINVTGQYGAPFTASPILNLAPGEAGETVITLGPNGFYALHCLLYDDPRPFHFLMLVDTVFVAAKLETLER